MCNKCRDTGARPMTADELDAADQEGYDPEDTMIHTSTVCECPAGQEKNQAFWATWGPIIKQGVKEIVRRPPQGGWDLWVKSFSSARSTKAYAPGAWIQA